MKNKFRFKMNKFQFKNKTSNNKIILILKKYKFYKISQVILKFIQIKIRKKLRIMNKKFQLKMNKF